MKMNSQMILKRSKSRSWCRLAFTRTHAVLIEQDDAEEEVYEDDDEIYPEIEEAGLLREWRVSSLPTYLPT